MAKRKKHSFSLTLGEIAQSETSTFNYYQNEYDPICFAFNRKPIHTEGRFGEIYLGRIINSKETAIKKVYSKVDSSQRKAIIEALPALHQFEFTSKMNTINVPVDSKEPPAVYYEDYIGISLSLFIKWCEVDNEGLKIIATQILKLLTHLWDKGYYHKNLHDNNVFINEKSGELKVSDIITDSICIGSLKTYSSTDLVWRRFKFFMKDKDEESFINKKYDMWCLGFLLIELIAGGRVWEKWVESNFEQYYNKFRGKSAYVMCSL